MREYKRPYLAGQPDPEFRDATLTEVRRDWLKAFVHCQCHDFNFNHHELMYLAGAFEDAARRKRDEAS